MIVLGIESSCDETGVAVVRDGKKILSNVIASSLKMHSKYGGVIPEIASRMQLESIAGVFCEAIKIARVKPEQIDLVSVTSGPGLPGSLLVGISFAKALALSLDRPILGINHIHGHVYANILCQHNLKMPCVGLAVSGGHTTLFYIEDFSKIKILGETRDDACGEAFDKVAKIMGLGYPGGPLIEKLAKGGDERKIKFACSGTDNELDFSFSGIKTAVLYYVCRLTGLPVNQLQNWQTGKLANWQTRDIAASFQEIVINTLIQKSFLACKLKKTHRLVVGGGVAANNRLREKFFQAAKQRSIECYFPAQELCTDNAAMVAGLADYLYQQGLRSDLNLDMELN